MRTVISAAAIALLMSASVAMASNHPPQGDFDPQGFVGGPSFYERGDFTSWRQEVWEKVKRDNPEYTADQLKGFDGSADGYNGTTRTQSNDNQNSW